MLEHGTGALNINTCRTGSPEDKRAAGTKTYAPHYLAGETNGRGMLQPAPHDGLGRWPTNVVLSHPPLVVDGEVVGDACADGCVDGCPVAELDRQSGMRRAGGDITGLEPSARTGDIYGAMDRRTSYVKHRDEGGASRFFPTFRYEAKAPASERPKLPDGTAWPTVKPVTLMRWLVRLVTPPNGVVLDPFAGTGTTAEAAVIEGFRALLIERDPQAAELVKTRLGKPIAPVLGFEGEIA